MAYVRQRVALLPPLRAAMPGSVDGSHVGMAASAATVVDTSRYPRWHDPRPGDRLGDGLGSAPQRGLVAQPRIRDLDPRAHIRGVGAVPVAETDDAARIGTNYALLQRATTGDQWAIAALRILGGGWGARVVGPIPGVFPDGGTVRAWPTDAARADARARYSNVAHLESSLTAAQPPPRCMRGIGIAPLIAAEGFKVASGLIHSSSAPASDATTDRAAAGVRAGDLNALALLIRQGGMTSNGGWHGPPGKGSDRYARETLNNLIALGFVVGPTLDPASWRTLPNGAPANNPAQWQLAHGVLDSQRTDASVRDSSQPLTTLGLGELNLTTLALVGLGAFA